MKGTGADRATAALLRNDISPLHIIRFGWTLKPGSGAPEGSANGRYVHGMRSREHLDTRRLIREMIFEAKDLAEMLG
jgi:hypothetical protein